MKNESNIIGINTSSLLHCSVRLSLAVLLMYPSFIRNDFVFDRVAVVRVRHVYSSTRFLEQAWVTEFHVICPFGNLQNARVDPRQTFVFWYRNHQRVSEIICFRLIY